MRRTSIRIIRYCALVHRPRFAQQSQIFGALFRRRVIIISFSRRSLAILHAQRRVRTPIYYCYYARRRLTGKHDPISRTHPGINSCHRDEEA